MRDRSWLFRLCPVTFSLILSHCTHRNILSKGSHGIHPKLLLIIRNIFSIRTAETDAERTFSFARRQLGDARNSCSSATINAIVGLSRNLSCMGIETAADFVKLRTSLDADEVTTGSGDADDKSVVSVSSSSEDSSSEEDSSEEETSKKRKWARRGKGGRRSKK